MCAGQYHEICTSVSGLVCVHQADEPEENPGVAKAIFEKGQPRAACARAAAAKRAWRAGAPQECAGDQLDARQTWPTAGEKDPTHRDLFNEGVIAGGSAKISRDSAIQAILPLVGAKMLNGGPGK